MEHCPIAEELIPIADMTSGEPTGLYAAAHMAVGSGALGAQFLDDAAIYDARYAEPAEAHPIVTAVEAVGAHLPPAPLVLDVCCGSGNATFRALKAFPSAVVWSVDLSPALLRMLQRRAAETMLAGRVSPVVADGSRLVLKRSSVDLLIGWSALHHFEDPAHVLAELLRAVKPGGVALFVEPFQAGHAYMRQVLIALSCLHRLHGGLSEQSRTFFENYVFTIDTMLNVAKSREELAHLDDKWMFTRAFFERAAKASGFRLAILPWRISFRSWLDDLHYKGTGDTRPLPEWAVDLVAQADAHLSDDLRDELLLGARVVFGTSRAS